MLKTTDDSFMFFDYQKSKFGQNSFTKLKTEKYIHMMWYSIIAAEIKTIRSVQILNFFLYIEKTPLLREKEICHNSEGNLINSQKVIRKNRKRLIL